MKRPGSRPSCRSRQAPAFSSAGFPAASSDNHTIDAWYAEMLSYQRTAKSLTGLVYLHEQLGALPHGHREMLLLDEIGVNEEYLPQYDRTMIKITSKIPVETIRLTEIEKNVLDTVIARFKKFKAEAISEYMHQETAYMKTRKNQPISFKYASELRPF